MREKEKPLLPEGGVIPKGSESKRRGEERRGLFRRRWLVGVALALLGLSILSCRDIYGPIRGITVPMDTIDTGGRVVMMATPTPGGWQEVVPTAQAFVEDPQGAAAEVVSEEIEERLGETAVSLGLSEEYFELLVDTFVNREIAEGVERVIDWYEEGREAGAWVEKWEEGGGVVNEWGEVEAEGRVIVGLSPNPAEDDRREVAVEFYLAATDAEGEVITNGGERCRLYAWVEKDGEAVVDIFVPHISLTEGQAKQVTDMALALGDSLSKTGEVRIRVSPQVEVWRFRLDGEYSSSQAVFEPLRIESAREVAEFYERLVAGDNRGMFEIRFDDSEGPRQNLCLVEKALRWRFGDELDQVQPLRMPEELGLGSWWKPEDVPSGARQPGAEYLVITRSR